MSIVVMFYDVLGVFHDSIGKIHIYQMFLSQPESTFYKNEKYELELYLWWELFQWLVLWHSLPDRWAPCGTPLLPSLWSTPSADSLWNSLFPLNCTLSHCFCSSADWLLCEKPHLLPCLVLKFHYIDVLPVHIF